MAEFNIVIAGGGLVGAVAALSLDRFAGDFLKVALIERSQMQSLANQRGRAYALSEGSRQLLEGMGLWEEMAAFAQPITEIDITDSELSSDYRPVFLHFSGNVSLDQPGAYIIEHEALAGPIYKALEQASKVEIFEETEVKGFESSQERAELRLANGDTHTANLIIGADGRSSRIRELSGIKVLASDYDQDGIVVTVNLNKPHHGKAVQHFLPSGPFAILPLIGDRASLVWTEKRALAADMCGLSDEDFVGEVNKRFTPKLGEVTLAGPRAHFPLSLTIARSFIDGRMALIGDAAHGVHPLAGQGMNIGLRDVAALVEILVETARLGLDVGSMVALERYQQWRRFDGVTSAFAMDGLNRLFSNHNSLLREVRGIGLRLVDRVDPLKAFFVREAAGLNGEVPRLMQGKSI